MTDLFLVTLATGAVRQLTHDAYADLQPAWSPDGRRIAFTTDRFTTEPDAADVRLLPHRAARRRVRRHQRRAVGIAGTHHLDPAWGPEGASLYFVSDPVRRQQRLPAGFLERRRCTS